MLLQLFSLVGRIVNNDCRFPLLWLFFGGYWGPCSGRTSRNGLCWTPGKNSRNMAAEGVSSAARNHSHTRFRAQPRDVWPELEPFGGMSQAKRRFANTGLLCPGWGHVESNPNFGRMPQAFWHSGRLGLIGGRSGANCHFLKIGHRPTSRDFGHVRDPPGKCLGELVALLLGTLGVWPFSGGPTPFQVFSTAERVPKRVFSTPKGFFFDAHRTASENRFFPRPRARKGGVANLLSG